MDVRKILDKVVTDVSGLTGILAVTMSGARANGASDILTDIDIAIYYDESTGFNVKHLKKLVQQLDDDNHSYSVTSLNAWGPLMNGGASMKVRGVRVDMIFRDINKVVDGIAANLQGKMNHYRSAKPPYIYLDVLYMGEIAICEVLYDPNQYIQKLKRNITHYPEQLRDALVEYYTFEASYSVMMISHRIAKEEETLIASHALRAISCLNQLLFTINQAYCIDHEYATESIENYQTKPENYSEKVNTILQSFNSSEKRPEKGMKLLQDLLTTTEKLAAS